MFVLCNYLMFDTDNCSINTLSQSVALTLITTLIGQFFHDVVTQMWFIFYQFCQVISNNNENNNLFTHINV